MDSTRIIESGEWRFDESLIDYRAEWPGNMLVERVTWGPNACVINTAKLPGYEPCIIAAPNYIWFRFWLSDDDQIVERYFAPHGEPVGTYLPITMELQKNGREFQTSTLILGLWIAEDGRVTVLNESEFDAAVAASDVNPVESERAEMRIRALTGVVAQKRFPPALIRNFKVSVSEADGDLSHSSFEEYESTGELRQSKPQE